MSNSKKRALFLDRDGVINHDAGYTSSIDDFKFIDGIFQVVQAALLHDYLVIVITNQAGIGRGFYTEQDFLTLTAWMLGQFKDAEAPITDVFFCPHHPEHGIGEYKTDSFERKPNPGMLLQAASKYDINLPASIMIGDKISDMQAAQSAGIENRWFYVHGTDENTISQYQTKLIANLTDAIELINSGN